MNWGVDASWTLFIDRDGVINTRKWGGYIETVDEFTFTSGTLEAFQLFQRFNHVFVVTNQQGIGKGIMPVCNLEVIHRYMVEQIQLNAGKITKVYFAPELKNDPNSTRKPLPFMAIKAQEEFENIDFNKSIMIGDTDSDIRFGKNLGMKTVRILTDEPIGIEADWNCLDLLEFAQKIK